jgi:hypothetical protein
MRFPLVILVLVPLAVSSAADAQRLLWDRLGSLEVRIGATRETLWAPGRRRYREVRLCVDRRALRVNSFAIGFPVQGGRWSQEQFVPFNRTIAAGQCSRETRIRGGARDIRQVEVRIARITEGPRPVLRLEAR